MWQPDALAPPVLFDAVLSPHRSLGRTGFRVLIAVFALVSAVVGVGFYLIGAWPVVGFLGLDVLLLWGALRLSYLTARRSERLRLSPEALTIRRIDPWGRVDDVRMQPPHWLRIDMDDPPRHESRLRISAHGRSVSVGNFLQPEERLEVAKALRAALARLTLVQSPSTSAMP
jgi:uncharacterized membrane protein